MEKLLHQPKKHFILRPGYHLHDLPGFEIKHYLLQDDLAQLRLLIHRRGAPGRLQVRQRCPGLTHLMRGQLIQRIQVGLQTLDLPPEGMLVVFIQSTLVRMRSRG